MQTRQQMSRSGGKAALDAADTVRTPYDLPPVPGHPEQLSAALAARVNAARGGGGTLAPATRTRMGRAFGHDFGDVRVHRGIESNELNDRLGAHAFTVGRDIFLGARASDGDSHLMAHELTHVVQQRQIDPHGAMTLGPLDDVYEREAGRNGMLVSHGRRIPCLPRPHGAGSVVQRFQFGTLGHGGIEQAGLHRAGFEGDMGSGDIGAIYFGNWLRDWSQVTQDPNSAIVSAAVYHITNILSWGEFGHALDQAMLGGYVPSEHLDNPLGGKTVEDAIDPASDEWGKSHRTLSPSQMTALSNDPLKKADAPDKVSGLPEYIERGKRHMRAKLEQAIQQGRTPEGMMNLGDALHVVEDYFSHSNFVEVALLMLASQGDSGAGTVLTKAKSAKYGGFDASNTDVVGKDSKGRGPAIITGTYGQDATGSANKTLSLLDQLESEIKTGALQHAFVKGIARMTVRGLSPLGTLGSGLGWLTGGIVGGVRGFGHGFARGLKTLTSSVGSALGDLASHPLSPPTGAIHGNPFGDAVDDMRSEAASEARSGSATGAAIARTIEGAFVDVGAKGASVVASALDPLLLPVKAALRALISSDKAKQIKKSAVGAPGGLPTHSQVAKDDADHPVYPAARALAELADQLIGKAMIEAWQHPDKAADVLALVDLLIAHPSAHPSIWEGALKRALLPKK